MEKYSYRDQMQKLERRLAKVEAALADLHSDRAVRLSRIDLEDGEWY